MRSIWKAARALRHPQAEHSGNLRASSSKPQRSAAPTHESDRPPTWRCASPAAAPGRSSATPSCPPTASTVSVPPARPRAASARRIDRHHEALLRFRAGGVGRPHRHKRLAHGQRGDRQGACRPCPPAPSAVLPSRRSSGARRRPGRGRTPDTARTNS